LKLKTRALAGLNSILAVMTSFKNWQEDSRYASLEAMDKVHSIFALFILNFDLYRPIQIEPKKIKEICLMLDSFSLINNDNAAKVFSSELSYFLSQSNEKGKTIWLLGV